MAEVCHQFGGDWLEIFEICGIVYGSGCRKLFANELPP